MTNIYLAVHDACTMLSILFVCIIFNISISLKVLDLIIEKMKIKIVFKCYSITFTYLLDGVLYIQSSNIQKNTILISCFKLQTFYMFVVYVFVCFYVLNYFLSLLNFHVFFVFCFFFSCIGSGTLVSQTLFFSTFSSYH